MYAAVDVGGTKTLVAAFDNNGKKLEEQKFATSQDYPQFLKDLADNVAKLTTSGFIMAGVAVPGRIDREHGRALGYGTLHWHEANIKDDFEKILDCPVQVENDAKLAGLFEGRQLPEVKDVLYVTIGTGISCALITDGQINPSLADSEGGQIYIDVDGKNVQWEDAASGRAIVNRFGKKASEIDDPATWRTISHDLALGLIDLTSIIQPDVIVLGGGVSAHFDKFDRYLQEALEGFASELVPIPPVKQATRPEEAVIYGCYELVKAGQ